MFYFNGARKPDFSKIGEINYNEYWSDRGFELNKKLKEREKIILSLIESGSSVLDVGCGNSLLPVKLKESGCDVSVADVSDLVLSSFNGMKIKASKMDIEDVKNFAFKEKYDYIILSEVIEHTRNPETIVRVLMKHTEYLIITIPNSAFYRYRIQLMFHGRFFTQWVMHPSEHLRYWSHIDFLDWCDAMGLKVKRVFASNGFSFFGLFPRLKDIWPNMFGHQIVYECREK